MNRVCVNCTIDFDTIKFQGKCPDCTYQHEPDAIPQIWLNVDAIPRADITSLDELIRAYPLSGNLTIGDLSRTLVTGIPIDIGNNATIQWRYTYVGSNTANVHTADQIYTTGIDPYA